MFHKWRGNRTDSKSLVNVFTAVFRCFNNHSSLILSATVHFCKQKYFHVRGAKNYVPHKFPQLGQRQLNLTHPWYRQIFYVAYSFSFVWQILNLANYGLCIYLRALKRNMMVRSWHLSLTLTFPGRVQTCRNLKGKFGRDLFCSRITSLKKSSGCSRVVLSAEQRD